MLNSLPITYSLFPWAICPLCRCAQQPGPRPSIEPPFPRRASQTCFCLPKQALSLALLEGVADLLTLHFWPHTKLDKKCFRPHFPRPRSMLATPVRQICSPGGPALPSFLSLFPNPLKETPSQAGPQGSLPQKFTKPESPSLPFIRRNG